MRRCPSILALALALPLGAAGTGPSTPFLRFVQTGAEEGRLETAVASYAGPRGVRVDLVASAHVADSAYYRRLEARFRGYDAVLYEMVKPKGYVPRPHQKGRGLISFFQRALRNVLDLEFQLDAIDYRARNFVHADLDTDTFFRLQKERGESIAGLLFRAAAAAMKNAPEGTASELDLATLSRAFTSEDAARSLKFVLARQLRHIEWLMAGLAEGPGGKGSVLLTERNKQAIRVLRREIRAGKRRIAIFYGAAHMADLEGRLTGELGFRRTGVAWETAWEIRPAAKGAGER